jgi:hypothetical protein
VNSEVVIGVDPGLDGDGVGRNHELQICLQGLSIGAAEGGRVDAPQKEGSTQDDTAEQAITNVFRRHRQASNASAIVHLELELLADSSSHAAELPGGSVILGLDTSHAEDKVAIVRNDILAEFKASLAGADGALVQDLGLGLVQDEVAGVDEGIRDVGDGCGAVSVSLGTTLRVANITPARSNEPTCRQKDKSRSHIRD